MSNLWMGGPTGGMSSDNTRSAAEAKSAAREANDAARDAEKRLDQLILVCAAMWELLRERTNLTEDDLIARIAMLDAKDGVADGKLSAGVQKCPKCGRVVAPKHQKCLYCGYVVPVDSVFKTI